MWEDVEHWMGVWSEQKEYWVEQERAARLAAQRGQPVGRGGGRW